MLRNGFTLLELTVAVALSGGIVAAAAGGMVALMARDRQGTIDRHHRAELHRAQEFISQEIRMAQQVSPCPERAAAGYRPTAQVKQPRPWLVLHMPASMGLPGPIVYYAAQALPQRRSVWQGPLLLYRWGPTLKLDGDYSDSAYANEMVLDRLALSVPAVACPASHSQFGGGGGLSLCMDPEGRSVRVSLSRNRAANTPPLTSTAITTVRSSGKVASCGAN
jgi:prepilin-type N-terminal cleavage/methylation domain-containing protein